MQRPGKARSFSLGIAKYGDKDFRVYLSMVKGTERTVWWFTNHRTRDAAEWEVAFLKIECCKIFEGDDDAAEDRLRRFSGLSDLGMCIAQDMGRTGRA